MNFLSSSDGNIIPQRIAIKLLTNRANARLQQKNRRGALRMPECVLDEGCDIVKLPVGLRVASCALGGRSHRNSGRYFLRYACTVYYCPSASSLLSVEKRRSIFYCSYTVLYSHFRSCFTERNRGLNTIFTSSYRDLVLLPTWTFLPMTSFALAFPLLVFRSIALHALARLQV